MSRSSKTRTSLQTPSSSSTPQKSAASNASSKDDANGGGGEETADSCKRNGSGGYRGTGQDGYSGTGSVKSNAWVATMGFGSAWICQFAPLVLA